MIKFDNDITIKIQKTYRMLHDYMYKKDNVEIRFLQKPKDGFRFGHDDGTEDTNRVPGYIKMVVIFRNE